MQLQDYFKAAKVKHPIPFADHIEINPDKLPRKHQISGLNRLLTNEHFGLYDKPGTGKTLIAHAYGFFWISEGQRVIAVMPPNLIYQFKEELTEVYLGADRFVKCHLLNQSPNKRDKLFTEWKAHKTWPQFLCMSYQMFAIEYQRLIGHYRVGIFDECQALKNSESTLHKKVDAWKNQKGGTSAVFMTGTPIHNELIDTYAMIHLTYPEAYASFGEFDRRHCEYTKIRLREPIRTKRGKYIRSFKKRTGYRNENVINKNLYKHGRRVLKEEVIEVKQPTIIEVPVQLATKHLALYKKLVRERLIQLENELIIATNAQALRQKCLQIVTCPELFTDHMDFKNHVVETCRELLDGIQMNETKAILFCNYQASVRNLAQYFEQYNPALMYGESSAEKNRQKFLKDATCRLLIANPKSAGAGFNFQSVCHNIIFTEPTGVPGDFQQCMDRVNRSGQKHLVNVWIVKALGTISPKATEEMLRKEGEAQRVYKDVHSFLEEFQAA